MDMQWHKIENIKKFFKNVDEVTLTLLDSETIKINDFFDVSENNFSLDGFNKSLESAKNECLRIVHERQAAYFLP